VVVYQNITTRGVLWILRHCVMSYVFSKSQMTVTRCWCMKKQLSALKKTKLRGLSQRANYTDWATAACWQS
jgi:hypothetical protein